VSRSARAPERDSDDGCPPPRMSVLIARATSLPARAWHTRLDALAPEPSSTLLSWFLAHRAHVLFPPSRTSPRSTPLSSPVDCELRQHASLRIPSPLTSLETTYLYPI